MDIIAGLKKFFGSAEPPMRDADPFDMAYHVRAAYKMLADANKKGIQIPADVVDVITQARRAGKEGGDLPEGLEARF